MSLINSTVWHSGEPSAAPDSRNCHIYSVWGRNEHQTPVPVLHSGNVKRVQIALDNLCHVEIAFQYILLETWPHTYTIPTRVWMWSHRQSSLCAGFSCWVLHAWWLKCLIWAWRLYIPVRKCAFEVVNLFVFICLLFSGRNDHSGRYHDHRWNHDRTADHHNRPAHHNHRTHHHNWIHHPAYDNYSSCVSLQSRSCRRCPGGRNHRSQQWRLRSAVDQTVTSLVDVYDVWVLLGVNTPNTVKHSVLTFTGDIVDCSTPTKPAHRAPPPSPRH